MIGLLRPNHGTHQIGQSLYFTGGLLASLGIFFFAFLRFPDPNEVRNVRFVFETSSCSGSIAFCHAIKSDKCDSLSGPSRWPDFRSIRRFGDDLLRTFRDLWSERREQINGGFEYQINIHRGSINGFSNHLWPYYTRLHLQVKRLQLKISLGRQPFSSEWRLLMTAGRLNENF